jgi:hypothetical protein
LSQAPIAALLEAVAVMLDDDDEAFAGLDPDDARRVASQVSLDLVQFGGQGLAGFATWNRAEVCRDCVDLADWNSRDKVALAFSRIAVALDDSP